MSDVGLDVPDFVSSHLLRAPKGHYIELNFTLETLYVGTCGADQHLEVYHHYIFIALFTQYKKKLFTAVISRRRGDPGKAVNSQRIRYCLEKLPTETLCNIRQVYKIYGIYTNPTY